MSSRNNTDNEELSGDIGKVDAAEERAEDATSGGRLDDARLGKALDELAALEGLHSVKQQIEKTVDLLRLDELRRKRGMKVYDLSHHMAFVGNCGTGRTTTARILGEIFAAFGVLKGGQLVETSRSDLVAPFVGQTAAKTRKKIEEAMGGVLYIEEADDLLPPGSSYDFGKEALDVLFAHMREHTDDPLVIFAGYEDKMEKFFSLDPRLPLRVKTVLRFEDYTLDELVNIFKRVADGNQFKLAPGVVEKVSAMLERAVNSGARFGGARYVRNLFEDAVQNIAGRLSTVPARNLSDEAISTILPEDIRDDRI